MLFFSFSSNLRCRLVVMNLRSRYTATAKAIITAPAAFADCYHHYILGFCTIGILICDQYYQLGERATLDRVQLFRRFWNWTLSWAKKLKSMTTALNELWTVGDCSPQFQPINIDQLHNLNKLIIDRTQYVTHFTNIFHRSL